MEAYNFQDSASLVYNYFGHNSFTQIELRSPIQQTIPILYYTIPFHLISFHLGCKQKIL